MIQENSSTSSFLKDLKSFASAVSFLKLFHKLTMRRKKVFIAIQLSRFRLKLEAMVGSQRSVFVRKAEEFMWIQTVQSIYCLVAFRE